MLYTCIPKEPPPLTQNTSRNVGTAMALYSCSGSSVCCWLVVVEVILLSTDQLNIHYTLVPDTAYYYNVAATKDQSEPGQEESIVIVEQQEEAGETENAETEFEETEENPRQRVFAS